MTYTVRATTGFAPLLTPRYDLADADFLVREGQGSGQRSSGSTSTRCRRSSAIEVTSRSNAYAMTPIEARDQAQIEMYGPRVGSTVTAHEICDEFTVGADRRAIDLAARALRPRQIHLQAGVGILPARTDGRGVDHRRRPGPSDRPASASSRSRRTTTAS